MERVKGIEPSFLTKILYMSARDFLPKIRPKQNEP
jgi:hypothetical protein